MADTAPLPAPFIEALGTLIPPERLLLEAADRWPYGYDNSRLHQQPGAVVQVISGDEIAAVVRLCREHRLAVTARGHGTGTAGAAVPEPGGVVISFEQMSNIVLVDPANRQMVVEPGVTNQAVQQAAAAVGFFWAPDPTSSAVCSIGGNLACNAAGPRSVKYGTPRENVLGLRFVDGNGEHYRTGVHTTKGVVGYDLTRLLIGSEGTLGIITEATLKLTPLAEAKQTLRALYRDTESAARAIAAIMAQPATPSVLEYMDQAALDMIRDATDVDIPEGVGALLMIEVDGARACVAEATRAVADAARVDGCIELREANSADEVKALWATRKALSPALRKVAPKKINEDVVVPVSRLPELVAGLQRLAADHAITIVNFGHAGNGNLHVNLLVNPDDPEEMAAAERCLDAVFSLVLALDGTLSGEHGIGRVKRDFVAREIEANALSLMRQIKRLFDPDNILNPSTTLPAEPL